MIVSHQNRKIKDIRRIQRCKDDRALLEGPHLVSEALDSHCPIEYVLATPQFAESESGRALLRREPLPVSLVAPALLEELCDADSPRGILAVTRLPSRTLIDVPMVANGLYVYADGVQDPGNLGALARVLEAFDGTALILGPGTAHPHHPRALRASAGSLLRLHVCADVPPRALSDRLSALSPKWVALTARAGKPLSSLAAAGTLVLAVGAEGPGLSTEVLEVADWLLTIPLGGQVESLNTTVAAAIVLYEISRQRAS